MKHLLLTTIAAVLLHTWKTAKGLWETPGIDKITPQGKR
jgi:hypothetical protein